MRFVDPASMTEGQRFAELAELLGRGVQRYFVAKIKGKSQPRISNVRLAAIGLAEAPCGSDVLNPKSLEQTR